VSIQDEDDSPFKRDKKEVEPQELWKVKGKKKPKEQDKKTRELWMVKNAIECVLCRMCSL
jgi:hypothetical protein